MNFLSSRGCQPNQTTDRRFVSEKDTFDKCTASPAAGGWWMGGRTSWTSPAGCPASCWSCASRRCFSSPGQGRHSPLLLGAPKENIPPAVVEAALAIALEGFSCDWLQCKPMKSCLCILKTINRAFLLKLEDEDIQLFLPIMGNMRPFQ